MKVINALTTLELLGSDQWGLITTAQATAAGVTRNMITRLTEEGTLQRVRHGVYALPSAAHSPLQDLRAAWLATDPKRSAGQRAVGKDVIAVSGASAAEVHRLGDLLASKHEFTSPDRHQTTQPDVRFRRRELPDRDVVIIEGLPVTNAVRTVSDLARDHTDMDHLSSVVRDALDRPDVRASQLADVLTPYATRFGAEGGKDLLTQMVRASSADRKAADLVNTLLSSHVEEAVARGRKTMDRLIAEGMIGIDIKPEALERIATLMSPIADTHRIGIESLIANFDNDVFRKALLDNAHLNGGGKPQTLPIGEAEQRS